MFQQFRWPFVVFWLKSLTICASSSNRSMMFQLLSVLAATSVEALCKVAKGVGACWSVCGSMTRSLRASLWWATNSFHIEVGVLFPSFFICMYVFMTYEYELHYFAWYSWTIIIYIYIYIHIALYCMIEWYADMHIASSRENIRTSLQNS